MRRDIPLRRLGIIRRTQNQITFLKAGFDPAGDLSLRDPGQHLRIGCRWFGTEISVILSKIAEILRNRLHRVEGVVEPFEGT